MRREAAKRGPARQVSNSRWRFMTWVLVGLSMLIGGVVLNSAPLLVWNGSNSVPRGLYAVWPGSSSAVVGQLVLARLPKKVQRFVDKAGFLPEGTPVLKYVAAAGGDIVCRDGDMIRINGQNVAIDLKEDRFSVSLPIWSGCYKMNTDDVFLLGAHWLSFDSRYFGVISRRSIIGRAYLIW